MGTLLCMWLLICACLIWTRGKDCCSYRYGKTTQSKLVDGRNCLEGWIGSTSFIKQFIERTIHCQIRSRHSARTCNLTQFLLRSHVVFSQHMHAWPLRFSRHLGTRVGKLLLVGQARKEAGEREGWASLGAKAHGNVGDLGHPHLGNFCILVSLWNWCILEVIEWRFD